MSLAISFINSWHRTTDRTVSAVALAQELDAAVDITRDFHPFSVTYKFSDGSIAFISGRGKNFRIGEKP